MRRDRVAHFVVGASIALVGVAAGEAVWGLCLSVLFGVGKELADAAADIGEPDVLDALATALGGVLVVALWAAWRGGWP